METDTEDHFLIPAVAFLTALLHWREIFEERGVHSWEYWRGSADGQAALCEILLDLFEESDAALLLEVWQAIEE